MTERGSSLLAQWKGSFLFSSILLTEFHSPLMVCMHVAVLLVAATLASAVEETTPCDVDDRAACTQTSVSLLQKKFEVVKADSTGIPHPSGFSTSAALTTAQFLAISEPRNSKVVWTTLQNMQSPEGRAPQDLIKTGLKEPKGMSFDAENGYLFIADSGLEKIVMYSITINHDGNEHVIDTTHAPLDIVRDAGPVEWVTIDDAGDLFYSAPKTNSINKIEKDLVLKLCKGAVQASALQVAPQKDIIAAKQKALLIQSSNTSGKVDDNRPPQILSIYEGSSDDVSQPAAIAVDGEDLYWVNQRHGSANGAIVKGQVDPIVSRSGTFHTVQVSAQSAGARGLAISKKRDTFFFTRNGTIS